MVPMFPQLRKTIEKGSLREQSLVQKLPDQLLGQEEEEGEKIRDGGRKGEEKRRWREREEKRNKVGRFRGREREKKRKKGEGAMKIGLAYIKFIEMYSVNTLFTLSSPLPSSRFFCDCGAGALGCDCLLTGYKAYSSPKLSKLQHNQGNSSQPNVAVQQQNTATS